MAELLKAEMLRVGFDEAFIDSTGNVVGRIGNGGKIIHFDSHLDTVQVNDPDEWQFAPFSGEVAGGYVWGRGSVDMKAALGASVYAAALAKERGYTAGKTIYVTGTVCEEYCDGENLKHLYQELSLRPDCIICEPSDNVITLGRKGKAQIRIKEPSWVSAHGSAPEKGVNAVYEMAEIITRVDALNKSLVKVGAKHGTIVLSDISCVSASLNAVPANTRFISTVAWFGRNVGTSKEEMDTLVTGKSANWEIGALHHTSWKGKALDYQPMHNPWSIEWDHD